MTKRECLAASIGTSLVLGRGRTAFAQRALSATLKESPPSSGNRRVPTRMAKTTKHHTHPGQLRDQHRRRDETVDVASSRAAPICIIGNSFT